MDYPRLNSCSVYPPPPPHSSLSVEWLTSSFGVCRRANVRLCFGLCGCPLYCQDVSSFGNTTVKMCHFSARAVCVWVLYILLTLFSAHCIVKMSSFGNTTVKCVVFQQGMCACVCVCVCVRAARIWCCVYVWRWICSATDTHTLD